MAPKTRVASTATVRRCSRRQKPIPSTPSASGEPDRRTTQVADSSKHQPSQKSSQPTVSRKRRRRSREVAPPRTIIADSSQSNSSDGACHTDNCKSGDVHGHFPNNSGIVGGNINAQNITVNSSKQDLMAQLIDNTSQQLDMYKKTVGKLFVETPAFNQCDVTLKDKKRVAILGASGDGKTTIGFELLCRIRDKKNLKTIIISDREDWEKVNLFGQELVILFDNMLGRFEILNESLKMFWISQLPKIIQTSKIQVIITCRESIFSTAKNELENFELFNNECRVYLSGDKKNFKFNAETNYNIIKNHVSNCANRSEECDVPEVELRKISEIVDCVGYMQMCKLFASQPHYRSQGAKFFDHPADYFVQEMEHLRMDRNEDMKYNYCTLACVLVKQGLNVDQIDGDQIVREIAESCRIRIFSTTTLKSEITLAVERLKSIHLIENNDKYQFQHDLWVKITFMCFFKSNPSLVIKHCAFRLIEDLITTKGVAKNSDKFCQLSSSLNVCLVARLVSEIMAGNLERVFCHRCFTDKHFIEDFWLWLDMHYEQKQTVLRSVKSDMSLRCWRLNGRREYDIDRSVLFWSAFGADQSFFARALNDLTTLRRDIDIESEISDALVSACMGGNMSVFTWLLKRAGIHVKDDSIVGAAGAGNKEIVNMLLNFNGNNFSENVLSHAAWLACKFHRFGVFELIISQSGVNTGYMWSECLKEAAECKKTGDAQFKDALDTKGYVVPVEFL